MTVRFRLLGAVEATVDDRPIALGYAQLRCMLAVLLVDANQVVTTDQFIDRVWAENRLPREPRRAVHHNISVLRRALAAAPDVILSRSGAGYRLSVNTDTIDLHRFHALLTEAADNRGDERTAALLEQALALWTAEPFVDLDIDSSWLHHQRTTLSARRHTARLDLTDIQLRHGRHTALLAHLAADTTRHPLDERLAAQYLLALYRSGRPAEALEHYRHLQRALADQLGADPSPPLQQLHQRILTADPTLTAATAATADPGATTAMFSMRADIPTFTGRDTELDQLLDTVLSALDASGGAHAIAIHTVDGMPGVGKTTFSVHAAHRLADRFPDGNIFLDLRGHTPGQQPLTPGAALESLLRAAGVAPEQIPPGVEDRARLWRDRLAGKRVLVVLDDAADHDQVRPLLPGTAGNLVLITSRHRLAALDGVSSLTLNVLPPDQALALLVRLAGRVPAADGDDHAGMPGIVASCGFLPLAITLAGAQLRSHPSWSPTYLADLLTVEHERLEHLDVGDRSVRAAFDMSFQHRPDAEQRLFRLLGLHPGPDIDPFATAALIGGSVRDARRGLAGLHADHLIEETAPARYRLHDLLRVYARDLAADLDPRDRRNALGRVLAYYERMVQTANAHLADHHAAPVSPATDVPPLADFAAARAWLAAELPNLTACVHLAADVDKRLATRLAAALDPFLRLQNYTDQALDVHQTALTAAHDIGDKAGEADARTHLGHMQYMRDEYAAAADNLTTAVNLYTALNDQRGEATARTALGRVRYMRDDHEAATENLTTAVNLYTALNDQRGQATALLYLGRLRVSKAAFEAAVDALTRALDINVALGDRLGQATVLSDLGRAQYWRGDYAPAAENLTRSLEPFVALGDRYGQANVLNDLGRVQCTRGEYAAATESHTRALALFAAVNDRYGRACAELYLGCVRHARRDFAAATESLTRALDLFTALGDRLGQANTQMHLARVQCALGEYRAADENNARALDLFTSVGDPDGQAETLNNIGDLALHHAEAGDPYEHFSRALAIARNIGYLHHEAHALAGQARCLLRTADPTPAVELLRQAHSLYQRLGVPEAVEIQDMLEELDKTG